MWASLGASVLPTAFSSNPGSVSSPWSCQLNVCIPTLRRRRRGGSRLCWRPRLQAVTRSLCCGPRPVAAVSGALRCFHSVSRGSARAAGAHGFPSPQPLLSELLLSFAWPPPFPDPNTWERETAGETWALPALLFILEPVRPAQNAGLQNNTHAATPTPLPTLSLLLQEGGPSPWCRLVSQSSQEIPPPGCAL